MSGIKFLTYTLIWGLVWMLVFCYQGRIEYCYMQVSFVTDIGYAISYSCMYVDINKQAQYVCFKILKYRSSPEKLVDQKDGAVKESL